MTYLFTRTFTFVRRHSWARSVLRWIAADLETLYLKWCCDVRVIPDMLVILITTPRCAAFVFAEAASNGRNFAVVKKGLNNSSRNRQHVESQIQNLPDDICTVHILPTLYVLVPEFLTQCNSVLIALLYRACPLRYSGIVHEYLRQGDVNRQRHSPFILTYIDVTFSFADFGNELLNRWLVCDISRNGNKCTLWMCQRFSVRRGRLLKNAQEHLHDETLYLQAHVNINIHICKISTRQRTDTCTVICKCLSGLGDSK